MHLLNVIAIFQYAAVLSNAWLYSTNEQHCYHRLAISMKPGTLSQNANMPRHVQEQSLFNCAGPDRGSDYGVGYPHTMTAEWEDATRKMEKFQKASAITEFINEREHGH